MDKIALLRQMMLIRAFEAALMARPDHGFQLLSTGEEAVAVGLCAALAPDDQLLSSGRAIGPALARGIDSGAVMGELLGKTNGTNQGRGGRGHLARPDQGFFGAHAVVGGNLTIAAGVALAGQAQHPGQVTICLFGDGACGNGALHETMNLAALWQLPLLLVCNNNHLSISTPVEQALAPRQLIDLAAPFGIRRASVDGMDVEAVYAAVENLVGAIRQQGGPAFLECHSERFAPHSSATRETRPADLMAQLKAGCPIKRYQSRLEEAGLLSPAQLDQLEDSIASEVADAMAAADSAPFPRPDEVLRNVW